jgi:hypothetical protein
MHHHRFYAVKKLADAQAEEQVSTLFLRLNDKGLTGKVCRARIMALQRHCKLPVLPTLAPDKVRSCKNNFSSGVCKIMAERGVTFDIALAQDFGLPEMAIRVEEFFKGNISDNILSKLVERKVYFVDQLLDGNKSLKS